MPTVSYNTNGIIIAGRFSSKTVYGEDKLVQPFIGYDEYRLVRLGVLIGDGETILLANTPPQPNVYAIWRALRFIELMQVFTVELMDNAYVAALRVTFPRDEVASTIVDHISKARYDAIMNEVIPDNIATLVMNLLRDRDLIDVRATNQELEYHTLGMRRSFPMLGIRMPLIINRRTQAEQSLLLRFQPMIIMYLAYAELNVYDTEAEALELSICQAAERNHEAMADIVIMGLAILRSRMNCRLGLERDKTESDLQSADTRDVIAWCSSSYRKDGWKGWPIWAQWGAAQNMGQYITLISQLFSAWDSLPVTPLPVPE